MHFSRLLVSCAQALLFSVVAVSSSTGLLLAQEIKVSSNVVANPPGGGWHPLYEIHADPENGSNLIICGAKWNAKDNASYGFVYSSSDGGKTWHQALEDKNST